MLWSTSHNFVRTGQGAFSTLAWFLSVVRRIVFTQFWLELFKYLCVCFSSVIVQFKDLLHECCGLALNWGDDVTLFTSVMKCKETTFALMGISAPIPAGSRIYLSECGCWEAHRPQGISHFLRNHCEKSLAAGYSLNIKTGKCNLYWENEQHRIDCHSWKSLSSKSSTHFSNQFPNTLFPWINGKR